MCDPLLPLACGGIPAKNHPRLLVFVSKKLITAAAADDDDVAEEIDARRACKDHDVELYSLS